jgi:dTDP-4-amino-4,6-dideoxygalactose transaminase
MNNRTNQPLPVPMSSPDLSEAERQAVAEVMATPRLSMGPKVDAFERAVADYVGVKHAVAVNSGTAGLHLCVRAAGVVDRDLVLTTPFSFVASANVILYERAIPVFVDVDPDTGNIDPEQVERSLTDLTAGRTSGWLPRRGADHPGPLRAMIPVDVFGQPADYDRLLPLARTNGLRTILDACESLGARHDDRAAGTMGDAGVYAFYPNKQITTAEGGLVVTDDDDWAQLVRALRNQGRAPGDTWLDHTYLGYNYRLNELNAALGLAQMGRLEALLAARQQVADWYNQRLAGVSRVQPPAVAETTSRTSWFVYVVRLEPASDRRQLMANLEQAGVPTRPYFSPIHLQPYFVERFGYQPGDFPVTEDLGRRSLALPFSGVMTEAQVDRVVEELRAALRKS